MLLDPGVLHSDSFAKYAVAFFKISRSSSARRSSLAQPLVLFAQLLERGVLAARLGGGANFACQSRRLCSLTPTAFAAALQRVPFLDHQPHRIPLELFTKSPQLAASLPARHHSSFGPPTGTIIRSPPLSESPGLSHLRGTQQKDVYFKEQSPERQQGVPRRTPVSAAGFRISFATDHEPRTTDD